MDCKLLDELQNWSNEFDTKRTGSKALRSYNKCMRRGKIDLANKIKKKYGKYFPQSDMAVAFGMMLMAQE